jgi:hypothetical protein
VSGLLSSCRDAFEFQWRGRIPAARFWLFQGMETALFVALALALLGLTIWWVRRRIS